MRETGGLQSPWSSELFQADSDLRPGCTVSSWASPSTPLDLRFLLCEWGWDLVLRSVTVKLEGSCLRAPQQTPTQHRAPLPLQRAPSC